MGAALAQGCGEEFSGEPVATASPTTTSETGTGGLGAGGSTTTTSSVEGGGGAGEGGSGTAGNATGGHGTLCDPHWVIVPATPEANAPFDVQFTSNTAWTGVQFRLAGPGTTTVEDPTVMCTQPPSLFCWETSLVADMPGAWTVSFIGCQVSGGTNECTERSSCDLDVL